MERWHDTIERLVGTLDGLNTVKSIQRISDRKSGSGGVDEAMERGTF